MSEPRDWAGKQSRFNGREHLDPIGHANPAMTTFGQMAEPKQEGNGEVNPGGLTPFPTAPTRTHGAKQKREGHRANRG